MFKKVNTIILRIGFFYGTSNEEHCGCGMVIVINKDHFLYICGGLGSNTKAELLSLYALLLIAFHIGPTNINIYGDSNIIIDWLNCFTNVHVIFLKHSIQKIQDIRRSFMEISFRHISTCYNDTTNTLSKESLPLKFSSSRIQSFLEGVITFEGEMDLKELM